MDKPKNPLGGVEPWRRTLYILFTAQFMVAVGFSSIFPFLPFYVEELGTNTSLSIEFLAGLVYSAQGFTMMIAAPIWGTLADRLGRKIMVERAMFGGAVLLLLIGFARSAEQVVLLRAIQGLVTGTVAAANALVAAETPRKHTGYAMGFLQVGFGTGLAIGPLIGGVFADAFGYAAAFYITAGLLFLAGVLVFFGIQEKFTPVEKIPGTRWGFKSRWVKIFQSSGVPITFGMRFLGSLGRMMIIPIIPLFIDMILTDPERLNTFTGLMMGVASAATTLSAVYLGRLGDRIGHRKVLIACSLASGLLYIPQALISEAWQLMVFQVLVGIAIGGIIPTISALLATYTSQGEEGAVYGLDNSINAAGRTVAPLLGAWVATGFGLRTTFTATAAIFMISVLLAVWLLPKSRLTEIATESTLSD
jgi:DHA1 family multidrug resistance protein-like MFS transporter